ncbi:hypothetical protein HYPSUDRAFT_200051 [Hypholoma sublateritium FD-334 SS-4]|uniref:Uncharacterized protein n=1 Tax=Hypholoma sublateritium (strain FD-334 SS-4) TaxID=945553 RepID=A0A0D2P9C9_HYPSF|nr:hypothetical protein HYPSUDRAFT_200051 [Hypholoma sublateritium FD-334 SS-4]
MLFATSKGPFTALILVALRVAAVSAAPAPAGIAIYDAADDISFAAPVIDASVMFPGGDAAEWVDISAVAADARVITLKRRQTRGHRLQGPAPAPHQPPQVPKAPHPTPLRPKAPQPHPEAPHPKAPQPHTPDASQPPPKSKPRTGIRLPPLRIRVPIPRIKIPVLGRLPLPGHIDIGIASKGGKTGGKSGKGAAPGGRKVPGSDPRTWSPGAKGKGRGAVDGSRTPRGGRPASRVAQRKGTGRKSCACAGAVIGEEFNLENMEFAVGERGFEQYIVETVAEDGVDMESDGVEDEDTIADDEAGEDEEMEIGLGDEELDFGMEGFSGVEFDFQEFDDTV